MTAGRQTGPDAIGILRDRSDLAFGIHLTLVAGTRVRSTDYEFLVSARAREIVEEEGITVIGYSAILQQWQDVA